MVGIYAIVNKVNGKMYIGQSVNISMRWRNHRKVSRNENDKGYNYPLYRSIRKYGLDNFEFVILEVCEEEELNDKEIYWIDFYDTTNKDKGYNLHIGGGGSPSTGVKLTEDEVKEIKVLLQNTLLSQEEISRNFNVTYRTISHINRGDTWRDSEIDYPIRKENGGQLAISTKKINRCIDCGKEISEEAVRCRDCYYKTDKNHNSSKHGRKVALEDRPSRDELKYLIRTMPFTRIGEKYGVTDNAVRKWCETAKLPRKKKEINSYTDEEWDLV